MIDTPNNDGPGYDYSGERKYYGQLNAEGRQLEKEAQQAQQEFDEQLDRERREADAARGATTVEATKAQPSLNMHQEIEEKKQRELRRVERWHARALAEQERENKRRRKEALDMANRKRKTNAAVDDATITEATEPPEIAEAMARAEQIYGHDSDIFSGKYPEGEDGALLKELGIDPHSGNGPDASGLGYDPNTGQELELDDMGPEYWGQASSTISPTPDSPSENESAETANPETKLTPSQAQFIKEIIGQTIDSLVQSPSQEDTLFESTINEDSNQSDSNRISSDINKNMEKESEDTGTDG